MAAKERLAFVEQQSEVSQTFALAIGDPNLILDLRAISSAREGNTVFHEFWQCVQEVLAAMATAAEDRRHGGVVAYLAEQISTAELFRRAHARFDDKKSPFPMIDPNAKAPSFKWFQFQFWPANEHVRSAFQHTGRFPLRLQLQVRNLRKGAVELLAVRLELLEHDAKPHDGQHACAVLALQVEQRLELLVGLELRKEV